jgi:hypothetical protein
MLRWITAFALAIPPLAVALLTHQAIQRAWLPAIPWWDKLIVGAVLYTAVCVWCLKCAQKRLADLAPIPFLCIVIGTGLIFLDVLSFRVRPDIAAAWSATWGHIPWWDRLLLTGAVWGAVVYWTCRHERVGLRRALAATLLVYVMLVDSILEPHGPLEDAGWVWDAAHLTLMVAALVWYIVEAGRSGQGQRSQSRTQQTDPVNASGRRDGERGT